METKNMRSFITSIVVAVTVLFSTVSLALAGGGFVLPEDYQAYKQYVATSVPYSAENACEAGKAYANDLYQVYKTWDGITPAQKKEILALVRNRVAKICKMK